MQNTDADEVRKNRSLQSEDFCAFDLQCGPWSETPEWLTYDRNTDLSLYVNQKIPDKTTCSKSTTCGCNAQDVLYEETNDIILPFYYNKIGMNESQVYNYTEYDLYALKTRLLPEIQKVDSTYSVQFNVKEYEGMMYNVVEIYSGATFVPLKGDLYLQIRDIVINAMDENILDYALLIHGDFPIEYRGICLPSAWLSSILRILFMFESKCKKVVALPDMKNSCYTITKGPYYLRDNKVYVDLTDYDDLYSVYDVTINSTYKSYGDLYNQLHKRIINYLVDIYKLGSIVLNTNSSIITDFELQPLVVNTKMQLGIYMANYRTHHLRDVTRFLYRVLTGDKYIVVDPIISEKMKELGFDVKENVVFVENYRDLQIVWYWSDKVY